MAVKLEYKVTKVAYGAQFEYLHSHSLSKGSRQVFISFVSWVLLCTIALYLSVVTERPLYTLLFLVFLVSQSVKIIPTLQFKKYAITNYAKDLKEKDIALHLDDEGLTEITNGIVSKAPWTSVISYVLFKGNLFVELAGGLWAIVPSNTLANSSDTVDDAVEYLESKNVSKRNEKNA